MYDLLIKNGRVVDGKGGEEYLADIAIKGNRIERILPAAAVTAAADGMAESDGMSDGGDAVEAAVQIDASGCYVTPGLVDHHAHLFPLAPIGIPAEAACFSSGVTTAVDAGSTGCRTYGERRSFLSGTKLRIRSYLNVCSAGLDSLPTLEDLNPEHMEAERIIETFAAHKDELLGLKIRTSRPIVKEMGLEPLKAAAASAERAGVPLMVHITDPPAPLEDVFSILKPGDIVTHMYQNIGYTILDDNGKVSEDTWKAREKGILFEAADARAHFSFEASEAAVREGFLPDFIATDLTKFSMYLRPTAFNMAMQLAKYGNLGIPFPEVIKRCTWNPAENLGLSGQIGSLEEGKLADLAVFQPITKENWFGDRPLADETRSMRSGQRLYRPVLTIKDGETVYRDVAF